MNRRKIDTEDERLWVSVVCFLLALAFAGLLSMDDYEPTPRRGHTELIP